MAGAKKPVNIFQLKNLGDPKQVYNWRLWLAVISFGLMGAARGVDEGLISGAFNSKDFQTTIHYDSYSKVEQTNIKANVSAMVQIGSVGGALFAFLVCDRIGRLWATRQLCVLWIVGIAIFMGANGNLGAIYAGRFVAGLGVGQTVVVGPVYLAEIVSEAHSSMKRSSAHHHRPPHQSVVSVPVCSQALSTSYESPRYLVKKGKYDEALRNLSRVRHLPEDHEYVVEEMTAIRTSHEAEMEATMGSGPIGVIKEAFLVPSNLYRLYLALMAQLLSQWSGAGSITLYAPDLFALLGITGSNESLLITGIFGIVKLVAAIICALFLVDVIGRKRSLLIGITFQAISMIYVAGFLTSVPEMGVVDDFVLPENKLGPSRGAIAMIYISGFGWALGWNSMQYLLTAELFPLRIRALATSLAMTLHFVNQYGNSRAVPNMLLGTDHGGITPMGTFWFFSAVTVIGWFWVLFTVPETAGRSLETIDRLFELPWYKIGLYGARDAEQRDMVMSDKAQIAEQSSHVENVGSRDNTTRV
ncbi:unnamed protein product [Aspergillus oryzae]|uniref:Unnamed protein product n=1 Tax=Aspergillus oryzae TaxID=5062 RepID=A0AAN4YQF7_ASPOZ|nr:unnamed protein product [Aspergillus oryzae]GMF91811.1 unnamed protein product [Aspergillus oryzae]GMG31954.1 unnamed protein product [Aspergillus oryzae]